MQYLGTNHDALNIQHTQWQVLTPTWPDTEVS